MRSLVTLLLGIACSAALSQEPARPPDALTVEDVVKLVKAGVTEELVITRLKRYNKPFDLNSDEILELKNSGVSETIIRYLLDPTLPYVPPAPPPPAPQPQAPSEPPKDPLVLKVPPEPAIYWLADATSVKEAFARLDFKSVVPLDRGSKFASALTGGLKKGSQIGFLIGPASNVRVQRKPSLFYARLGTKASIEDIVLLKLDKEGGRRLLAFGPKHDKPVFSPDAIRQFEVTDVSEGVYRIATPPEAPGEYIFLVLGTGDERKGVLGKGYDFGVDAH